MLHNRSKVFSLMVISPLATDSFRHDTNLMVKVDLIRGLLTSEAAQKNAQNTQKKGRIHKSAHNIWLFKGCKDEKLSVSYIDRCVEKKRRDKESQNDKLGVNE